MELKDIKWDVFTLEDQEKIRDLVSKGRCNLITKAVMVDSGEKEYWIAKILQQVAPETEVIESEVAKELKQERTKGKDITSPEEEAIWQAKLDSEKKEVKTKLSKRKKEAAEKELLAKEAEMNKVKQQEDATKTQLQTEAKAREAQAEAQARELKRLEDESKIIATKKR